MKQLVVASRNKDKAREIKQLLKGLPVKVLTVDSFKGVPDVIEDGNTFAHNAAKKARVVSRAIKGWAIADDSGLIVRALNGVPGVRSARFAGNRATYMDNNLKVLQLLGGLPVERRGAEFVCTIAIANKGKIEAIVSGNAKGHIGYVLRGSNGFGYDPLFVGEGMTKSFGEISSVEKNRISHRARALARARSILRKLLDKSVGA